MSPRSCRWTKDRLTAFVGHDLDRVEAERARQHLRACASCRTETGRFLRARKALIASLGAAAPGVDDSFFASLHADVMEEVAGQETVSADVAPSGRQGWKIGIAAAAALLFALGLWSVRSLDSEGLHNREPLNLRNDTGTGGAGGQGFGAIGVSLRPLGDEDLWLDGQDGQGLMGRLKLRTLERETWRPLRRGARTAVVPPAVVEDGAPPPDDEAGKDPVPPRDDVVSSATARRKDR